jgi:hypothetical protein
MKTIINSKKFTQSLLLMSILCMSLNIMAPDEELITNRDTNTAELLEKKQAVEKARMDEAIKKARNESKESILESRTAEIAGEERTIEKKGFMDSFRDWWSGIIDKVNNPLKSQMQLLNDNGNFNFDNMVEDFRKLDTKQKREALKDATKTEFDNYKNDLKLANEALSKATGMFAKQRAQENITALKENFKKNLTSLQTKIKENSGDKNGMLNADQSLEILDSNGKVVKGLSTVDNLGDLTFKIISKAETEETQGKIDLENARKEDRRNKDSNKADGAKKFKLGKQDAQDRAKILKSKNKTISQLTDEYRLSGEDTELVEKVLFGKPSPEDTALLINKLNGAKRVSGIETDGVFSLTKRIITVREAIEKSLKDSGFNKQQVADYMAKITPEKSQPDSALDRDIDQQLKNEAAGPTAGPTADPEKNGDTSPGSIPERNKFEDDDKSKNGFNDLYHHFQGKK